MKYPVITALLSALVVLVSEAQTIPLPEHPRPDFERAKWQNLNGPWQFAFDSLNQGIDQHWQEGHTPFNLQINVPFPWGSPLSGVADKGDIGWYQRSININPDWKGKRIFLSIGASDWETTIWLDGHWLGTHRGGYTPFSFDLTEYIKYGTPQKLVVRADDKRRNFTLYGKQGYGNARGIWQTAYLEARGQQYIQSVQFAPDIDQQQIKATLYLPQESDADVSYTIAIETPSGTVSQQAIFPKGHDKTSLTIALPQPRLWTLEDPFLYPATIKFGDDEVKSYFGMRKISVTNLPGTAFPYISLNDKPVYLQLALDQSYHPEGFYTFPTDAFMKKEIELAKSIGLNGVRIHIKVEVPRKLYWADKLGLLIMADLPNSWGEPDEKMQEEATRTFREMVKRDFNHPSIFAWILFNETWGLRTRVQENGKPEDRYLPETQNWVASMYYLAKSLDPTRLAEDNSICCGAGHTQTDINSFHDYLPGWEWQDHLKKLTESSFEGSTYQFEAGFKQGMQPKINSECGNVWGYDGSTGDVDWSWDYHRMMNTFRQFPEIAGWLYTEHHDVINEWNGYWRFDRTNKFTGMEELVSGMKLNDLHAPVYLSTGNEISKTVKGSEKVAVPLFLSVMTGSDLGKELHIQWKLNLTNALGETSLITEGSRPLEYKPYMQKSLEDLVLDMPSQGGIAQLTLLVQDATGKVWHHNFMHFEVIADQPIPKTAIFSVAPAAFSHAQWSSKQWNILDGLKVCGAGTGDFEYTFKIDPSQSIHDVKEAYFLVEASAKEFLVKDRDQKERRNVDFMLGGKASPSGNPNAYPMTDEKTFPSNISVSINGQSGIGVLLPDDPADHRGVLSWHHQLKDRKLREAGSYGYLVKVPITKEQLKQAWLNGSLTVRLSTKGDGGIAIYGKSFGRYPLDPSVVLKFR